MPTVWRDQLGLSPLAPKAYVLTCVVDFCGFFPSIYAFEEGQGKGKRPGQDFVFVVEVLQPLTLCSRAALWVMEMNVPFCGLW